MSKEVARVSYLIPTDIGNMLVEERLVAEYDVEDIIRDRALSQGRYLQMVNVAANLDKNSNLPNGVVKTTFRAEA